MKPMKIVSYCHSSLNSCTCEQNIARLYIKQVQSFQVQSFQVQSILLVDVPVLRTSQLRVYSKFI